MTLYLLPLGLQAVLMFVDEFVFHRKRRLPRWERIGHPLDTLSVLACLGLTLVASPDKALGLYIGLSVFSCILITKDEWIHSKHCHPTENWLHALLFIIHPVVLYSFAQFWMINHEQADPFAKMVLLGSTVLIGAFFIYQLLYWNLLARDRMYVRNQ